MSRRDARLTDSRRLLLILGAIAVFLTVVLALVASLLAAIWLGRSVLPPLRLPAV
jgi:hypothetical protein